MTDQKTVPAQTNIPPETAPGGQAQQPEQEIRPQVIFLETGQVVWPDGVFKTTTDVEAFLQKIVYRDWENKVFNNIMGDLIRKQKAQAEAAEAAKEEAAQSAPLNNDNGAQPAAPPDLKVVEQTTDPTQDQLEAELQQKQAEIEALQAKLQAPKLPNV